MIETRYFVKIRVYDWDASPRVHSIRHVVATAEKAKRLATQLSKLEGEIRQSKWLSEHHNIYGFFEKVEGAFKETSEKL